MGLFRKKKMDYGYYSSYSSKRRRLRVGRAALAVIAGILLVVGIVVYFDTCVKIPRGLKIWS